MSYPVTGNTAPALRQLSRLAALERRMTRRGQAILKEISPALIGQQVIRYRRRWSICQVHIRKNCVVSCYGVGVTKRGKIGVRGFDLGNLEECEFVPPLVYTAKKRVRSYATPASKRRATPLVCNECRENCGGKCRSY